MKIKSNDKVLDIKKDKLDVVFEMKKDEDNKFVIEKDNWEVYEIFRKLYESYITGRIVNNESIEDFNRSWYPSRGFTYDYYLDTLKREYRRLRSTPEYEYLVKDNKIVWKDGTMKMEDKRVIWNFTSILEISMVDEKIVLQFKDLMEPNIWDTIIVRINSIDPRYRNLYIPFDTLYSDLRKMDLSNNQISIEEYTYSLKRVRSQIWNML